MNLAATRHQDVFMLQKISVPLLIVAALLVGMSRVPLQASNTATASSTAALPQSLSLYVGDSRVVDAETARIAVGNGKVVSASLVSAGQFVLIGQSPGDTVVQVWMRDGRQQRINVRVTESNLEAMLREVRELLVGVEGISARTSAGRILIEGEAEDVRARERVASIAKLYPSSVFDLVLKPGLESLIHVDVKIVEFRRGRLRELGIRWRDDVSGPSAGVIADFVTNDRFRSLGEQGETLGAAFSPVPAYTKARAYLGLATTLDSRLRALEQNGEALMVAEPRLSCRSGGAARFVAGGEIPVPVINSVGATDVEFREYGVILDVKPVVESTDIVSLRVETELSQIDHAQKVAGIPGLLKRRSTTDINLRSGETVVLAGLIQRQRSLDTEGVPTVSRWPAVGRLFGVRGQRQEDSEIVIFLTPRIESPGQSGTTDREALQRARDRIDSLQTGAESRPAAPPKASPQPLMQRSRDSKGA